MNWNWQEVQQFLSKMGKSFKVLLSTILSIFLISDGLQLVSLLILIFFIPLFFIILSVPLDGSSVKEINEAGKQAVILTGPCFPSKNLIYISNAIKEISTFKVVKI